jgi:hypothetical protein
VHFFFNWQTRIRIAVKLDLELLVKSVTKSMPTTSQGLSRTPKGDKSEEPCLLGFARLPTTQLEQ